MYDLVNVFSSVRTRKTMRIRLRLCGMDENIYLHFRLRFFCRGRVQGDLGCLDMARPTALVGYIAGLVLARWEEGEGLRTEPCPPQQRIPGQTGP